MPGLAGSVPRWTHPVFPAVRPGRADPETVVGSTPGWCSMNATIDGILYPMRMRDMTSLAFVEELRRYSDQNAED